MLRCPRDMATVEFASCAGLTRASTQSVTRGLDPQVHSSLQKTSCEGMDCRVKPGNGGGVIETGVPGSAAHHSAALSAALRPGKRTRRGCPRRKQVYAVCAGLT